MNFVLVPTSVHNLNWVYMVDKSISIRFRIGLINKVFLNLKLVKLGTGEETIVCLNHFHLIRLKCYGLRYDSMELTLEYTFVMFFFYRISTQAVLYGVSELKVTIESILICRKVFIQRVLTFKTARKINLFYVY